MTNCPDCEYHKDRAARWRAEAYKQAGHDIIELPWVGLTDEEIARFVSLAGFAPDWAEAHIATQIVRVLEAKLKEKNT